MSIMLPPNTSRIRPLHIVVGFVILVLWIGALYLLVSRERPERSFGFERGAPSAAGTTSQERQEWHDPPALDAQVEALNQRIAAFTRAYYTYDSSLTAKAHRRAVREFATPLFLKEATFGLHGEPGAAFRREEARMIGRLAEEVPPGEFFDPVTVVDIPVVVEMKKIDQDGRVVLRFDTTVYMSWVYDPQHGWRIIQLVS